MSDEAFQKNYNIKKQPKIQYIRHIIQLIVLFALNAKIFGAAKTYIIVPYLWPTQAPYSAVIGAYDGLEYTLAQGVFPLLTLGVIYISALTVGRLFCAWACPFGMIQDFLAYLPFKKKRVSKDLYELVKDLKYVLLGFSLLVSLLVGFYRIPDSPFLPAGVFSDSFFSVLSPSSTIFAYVPWMFLWKANALANAGIFGWIKVAALIAVLMPSLYIPRFFCRFLCPLGALMGTVSRFKILKLRRSNKNENIDNFLNEVCPMGVTAGNSEFIIDHNCTHCGRCTVDSKSTITQEISFLAH
eukprot:TRINITY_DN8438_c0_g1_i1.p1 TRINITY_DN8438_c0_g1~~TRINITY_DN8438_c0_g1_i1.p1  ORF type:complete len:298 (+),score=104.03 TRINITY_DN8438_c0_g1_i1:120-1013(+)